jgi:poly-gamma-glutamate biosynthesis protein PgsC/CapC
LIENPQLIGLVIGIGMMLSLILTETLGVTAGGVIVPGYIAIYIHEPYKIIITFIVALIVLLIIRLLSNFMFIYGKRRLVLSLMLGFFFGYLSKMYLGDIDSASIGNIIPGLLASWMDRQGALKTISVLIIIAVAARLIFIVLMGGYFYV